MLHNFRRKCIIIHAYMSSQCGFPFWGLRPNCYSTVFNCAQNSWIFMTLDLVGAPQSLQLNRGFSVCYTLIAKDWAQHFVNWNERLICINDWYLFVLIHEKDLLSISSVVFIVHLRVINALKCYAGITQKYGVTSCRVFFCNHVLNTILPWMSIQSVIKDAADFCQQRQHHSVMRWSSWTRIGCFSHYR